MKHTRHTHLHTRHTHLHTHDTIYIFQSMFGAQMPPSPVKMTPKRRGMSSTAPPSAHDMLLTPPQPTPNPPEFTKSSLTRRPDVEFRRLGWALGPRADVLSWAASLILALTRQKSSGSSPPHPASDAAALGAPQSCSASSIPGRKRPSATSSIIST